MEQVLLKTLPRNERVQQKVKILQNEVLRRFVCLSKICKSILLLPVEINAEREGNRHGQEVPHDQGPIPRPEYLSHQVSVESQTT